MAEQFGMDVEMVKKYLSKEQVHDQILTQKAVAVVVDSATAEKPAKKTAKKAETAEGEEKKPAKKTTRKKADEDGEEKKPAKKATKKAAAKKEEETGTTIILYGDPRYDRKKGDEDDMIDLVIDEKNPDNYFLDYSINRIGGNLVTDYYNNQQELNGFDTETSINKETILGGDNYNPSNKY